MRKHYDIAAFVWPAFTGDEVRTRPFWPMGMGEWETVMNTDKKWEGHSWPRRPLWGYVNEADPYVMEMEINVAADHGVNVFIYDWYWFDNRPFLENCLNDGFLKAKNNDRMKFYLMWANHNVTNGWDKRIAELRTIDDNIIWMGTVKRDEFERLAKRAIDKYFHHPSYYKIDGKPVFMIYEINNFISGLGGLAEAKSAVEWFKEECVKAGFPGLHLQLSSTGENGVNMSGFDSNMTGATKEALDYLGFDSFTNYQFCHFTDVNRDYLEILKDVEKEWQKIDAKEYTVPYFPHVSVGWDNNPRFKENIFYETKNNTPENVKKAFQMAKDYIDSHPDIHPLITVNSWNEWTETSYLEPDNLYGYGYLEAIKEVFCKD